MTYQIFSTYPFDDHADLWITDGASVRRLYQTQDAEQAVSNLASVGGSIDFFSPSSGGLWRTDGTTDGTFAIPLPGTQPLGVSDIGSVGGRLLVQTYARTGEMAVYATDGTFAGTVLLPIEADGYAQALQVGSQLLVSAVDYAAGPGEQALWITDGTPAGTRQIATDVPNQGGLSFGVAGRDVYFSPSYDQLVRVDLDTGARQTIRHADTVTFPAGYFPVDGRMIVFTSGDLYVVTGDSLTALTDSVDGAVRGPNQVVAASHELFFGAISASGNGVFVTNGDPAGVRQVASGILSSGYALGDRLLYNNVHDGRNDLDLVDVSGVNVVLQAGLTFDPADVVAYGGQLIFSAHDEAHGAEVWATDGTAAGTHLLRNVPPGTYGSPPSSLSVTSAGVVFSASDAAHGSELWVTDGAAGGTRLLDDIDPEVTGTGSLSGPVAAAGQRLFFAAGGPDGVELWTATSDGSGAREVADQQPGTASSNPIYLTAAGDRIVYLVTSSTAVPKFLGSDGSAASVQVLGATTGFQAYAPTSLNGAAYFTVGGGLLRTDGTTAGTVQVSSIRPEAPATVLAGAIIFHGYDDATNIDGLYRYDPADGSTSLLLNNMTVTILDTIATSGERLYFRGFDGSHGQELWTTDGTSTGTHLVEDIAPGFYSSQIADAVAFTGGRLVFSADDTAHGAQLWVSDGTEAGTFALTSTPTRPVSPTVDGGRVFFFDQGAQGLALWVSDGTVAGTHLAPGAPPGGDDLIAAGPALFYTVETAQGGTQLWRVDATTGASAAVGGGAPSAGFANPEAAAGDTFVFAGYDAAGDRGLFSVAPGAAGATFLRAFTYINSMTSADGRAFFTGQDATGSEVWSSDGTVAGTVPVTTVGYGNGSAPSNFAPLAHVGLIDNHYHVLLDRPAAADEVDYWNDLLKTGAASMASFDAALASTSVAQGHIPELVRSFYEVELGRSPAAAELQFWVGAISSGQSDVLRTQAVFAAQPDAAGHTETAVTEFYETFLGREPLANETDYWSTELTAGTSELFDVERFLSTLPSAAEHEAATVARGYEAYLGRDPTAAETGYWTGQLSGGLISTAGLRDGLLDDASGVAHTVSLLDSYYETYLGRDATASEVDYWNRQLHQGESFAAVEAVIRTAGGSAMNSGALLALDVHNVSLHHY